MRSPGLTLRVYASVSSRDDALLDSPSQPGLPGSPGSIDALSFTELVEALRLEGGRSTRRRVSDELARSAALSAAQSLKPGPFGELSSHPGSVFQAAGVLRELRQGGASPESMKTARGERIEFLGRLLSLYEEALSGAGWIDGAGALEEATDRLEGEGLPRSWRRYRMVELLGFWQVTPMLRRFLKALSEQCERAELLLRLEVPAAGMDRLDGAVDGLFTELEREASGLRFLELAKEDRVAEGRPLAEVAARLFSEGPRAAAGSEASHGLRIRSVAGTAQEVRGIAAGVSQLLRQGASPESIAVVYRDVGPELCAIAEELRRRGIATAHSFGDGRVLTASRRALELLSLQRDHFPAARTAALLSARNQRAASLLARAGVRDDLLGASGGTGGYVSRLETLARRSREPLAMELRDLAEGFGMLVSCSASIPEEGLPSAFLSAWWRAISGSGLFEQELSAGLLELLQQRLRALGAAIRNLPLGAQRCSRPFFAEWMAEEVDRLVPQLEAPVSGVSLLGAEALVGRRFDHLFLGGLSEGRFPRWGRAEPPAQAGRIPAPPLLLDSDRVALNRDLGWEALPVQAGRGDSRIAFPLAQERLLFYLALTSATRSVTASYARRGPSGEQVISPFLDALCQAAGCAPVSVASQAVPGWSEAWSQEALRECCAREWAVADAPRRTRLRAIFGSYPWFNQIQASAEMEQERQQFAASADRPEGRFSGAIARADLLDALRDRFPFSRERPGSASALYQFGNCAFQGFLTYALGLREEGQVQVGEEMDARAEGIFWHAVLEQLLPRLDAQGLLGRPGDEIPDAPIDAAVDAAWKKVGTRLHLGHPALRAMGRARGRSMVRRLLSTPGSGLPVEGGVPAHFELPFGDDRAPEGWREVRIPGRTEGESDLFFKGSIDRVDQGPSGTAVIDYKSRALEAGTALYEELLVTEFQLPLYLYAARAAQSPGRPEPQAVWLSLKDGKVLSLNGLLARGGGSVESLLADDLEARSAIAETGGKNLPNSLHRIASAIRQGRFGARPHDCERCDYASVCRVSGQRQEAADAE